MNLNEGKAAALKLCRSKGISFEALTSKSQARDLTKIRREIVLALYELDLREWQIAKIIERQQSTIWAYRHLEQKKAAVNEYKKRNSKDHLGSQRDSGPGRNAVKRYPPKRVATVKTVGRVSRQVQR